MNLFSKIALAGVGIVALAGGALAAERAMHLMEVSLPDGSVAHVRYFGDVAPNVEVVPVSQAVPIAMSDPRAAFAAFDEMFADMDRQQEAMLQQVAAMQLQAATGALPQGGTVSYSYTAYSSGDDGKGSGCTQSYQLASYGNARPEVVSQRSGDCSKAAKFGPAPTRAKAPAPAPEPNTVPHEAA